MSQSQRKAIGVVLTLISIVVWAALAVWVYEALVANSNAVVTLIYFVAAGLGWVFPAMVIIRWMARPDA